MYNGLDGPSFIDLLGYYYFYVRVLLVRVGAFQPRVRLLQFVAELHGLKKKRKCQLYFPGKYVIGVNSISRYLAKTIAAKGTQGISFHYF